MPYPLDRQAEHVPCANCISAEVPSTQVYLLCHGVGSDERWSRFPVDLSAFVLYCSLFSGLFHKLYSAEA